jgi:hypothetical protein
MQVWKSAPHLSPNSALYGPVVLIREAHREQTNVLRESRRVRRIALSDQTKTTHDDVLPSRDQVGPPTLRDGRKPTTPTRKADQRGPSLAS